MFALSLRAPLPTRLTGRAVCMKALDVAPVTDDEIARALRAAIDAVQVADALLGIASPRQIRAVFDPCPLGDLGRVRTGLSSWMDVVLDGMTGLRLTDRASSEGAGWRSIG